MIYLLSFTLSASSYRLPLCSPRVRTQVPSQGNVIGVWLGRRLEYARFDSGTGSRFLSSPKCLDQKRAHVASLAMSMSCSFLHGQSDLGVKIAIYINLLPMLRMCGAIPLLLLFAFITCTGTTSSLRKWVLEMDFHFFFSCKHADLPLGERSSFHCLKHSLWNIKQKTDQHEHSPSAEWHDVTWLELERKLENMKAWRGNGIQFEKEYCTFKTR